MTKLAKIIVASAVAGLSLAVQAAPPSTNIVQNIAFQLTFLEQGPTNHPSTNVTIATIDKLRVTTKSIIAALGTATTNHFSANARLVRVRQVNPAGETVLVQVRDGTNRVDVTELFSGTFTESPIRSFTFNSLTGISTGVNFGVLHLVVTNTPPFNLTGSLRLAGEAVTKHASIKSGTVILTVDDVTAQVAGTGTDTNGIPAVVVGTVNIIGRVVERE